MIFSYKATKKDGTTYESTLDAVDRFSLYKELHSKGETVISVSEKGEKKKWMTMSISFGGIKMADKVMFAKNLSAMLRAGLPLNRSLLVLERQMKGVAWKGIFKSLQENLSKGMTFSGSLATHPKAFSSLLVSMVAAGEESGSLSGALSIVGEEMEKTYLLQKKIKGAMMYPGVIISLMLGIGILMLTYVLPKLTDTFKSFGAELPLPTKIILGASDFLGHYYIALIILVAGAIAGMYVFAKTDFGRSLIHKAFIKMPIFGTMVKEINSARMARTLSSLLSSGVNVVSAIKITADVAQNVHYKRMLERTAEDIQKGSTLESLFIPRGDLYPSFVGEMVGVGEETGTISKTLLEVALFYENEVDQKTKDMSTIIEPLMMVGIGLGVGFFALAIISPIYSLSSNI